MSDPQTVSVKTDDGRELCVNVYNPAGSSAVLINVGTPGSGRLYGPWVNDAVRRGWQLISYDRPGYGASTPNPGFTVADCAGDAAAICRALGVTRLAVWGFSGGGPATLACAAMLPGVVAAATVGGVAPWGAAGLDYLAGTGEANVEDYQLYFADKDAARAKCAQDRIEMLAATKEEGFAMMESLLSPVDAAALTGEFADYVDAVTRNGVAPSEQGWWDDGVSHIEPWGFALSDIAVPVKVWHGRQDRFVPPQHGEWLAANVPGAEASVSEADGHLTLLTQRFSEIHDWLARYL